MCILCKVYSVWLMVVAQWNVFNDGDDENDDNGDESNTGDKLGEVGLA